MSLTNLYVGVIFISVMCIIALIIHLSRDVSSDVSSQVFQAKGIPKVPATEIGQLKIALLMTTHQSLVHLNFLVECWPQLLRQSKLLSNADIFVYSTHEEMSDEWFRAFAAFPNKHHFHFRSNPGYQEGAIAAIHDYSFISKIDSAKYDWVVRINPDVLLLNTTRLERMMIEPNVDAILVNCKSEKDGMGYTPCNASSGCIENTVNTDFTALRPSLLHKISWGPILFPTPEQNKYHQLGGRANAEMDMTNHLRGVIENHRDRWISPLNPVGGCRVQLPGEIMHTHDFKCNTILSSE